jgi:predicted ATPase
VESFVRQYGYDGGLYGYAYGMASLWNLGYPDQAEALRAELLAIAERTKNPFSLSIALAFGATLAHDRGESDAALEMSDRLIALALEQRLYLWVAAGTCERGGALVLCGDTADGIAQIRQGLALYQGIGVLLSYAYYLTYLAEGCLRAGDAEPGLAAVDEGLTLCPAQLCRFHEAELRRLRGKLLLLKGDLPAGEAALRDALSLADRQGARSFALRAATSLASLLRERGQSAEAHALLAPVYDRFDEGFATKDVRDAAAVLREVGRPSS